MKPVNAAALGDLLSGAALIALGAAGLFWMVDAQVRDVEGFGVNARLYPKILFALLMVLGAGVFIGGLMRGRDAPGRETDLSGLARVIGVTAVGGLFATLAPVIGFTAAAILATGAFAAICGVRRPVPLAAVSLGAALAIRLIAVELIGLTLPGLGSI